MIITPTVLNGRFGNANEQNLQYKESKLRAFVIKSSKVTQDINFLFITPYKEHEFL